MRLYIVHAFTQVPFGGNPAGVVLLRDGEAFPADELMRRIAAELRYSETVFVKRLSAHRFEAKYFTPVEEVDLCGHASIAAAHSLLESGAVQPNESVVFDTRAGALDNAVENGQIWMDMAPPKVLAEITNPIQRTALYTAFGLPADGHGQLMPAVVSTGLPDILLPVKDRETLARMRPKADVVAALSQRHGAVGVHAFAVEGETGGIFARNFAPLLGIDEEAATGTGNGALAAYLNLHGLLDEGKVHIVVQGEAMGRASQVLVRVHKRGAQTLVQVGGYAATFAVGELML